MFSAQLCPLACRRAALPPHTHFCAKRLVWEFLVWFLSSVLSRCSWTWSSQRNGVDSGCVETSTLQWTRSRAVGNNTRPLFLFFLASRCNTARVDLGLRNNVCQSKVQLLTRSGFSLLICGAAVQDSCDFRGLHNTTNWKAACPSDTQLFFASSVGHHSG